MFRFAFDSLTFSDGSTISLPHDGAVLVVGANNVGKSQLLRDLIALPRFNEFGQHEPGKVLDAAELSLSGTREDLEAYLRERSVGHHGADSGLSPDALRQWNPDRRDVYREIGDQLLLGAWAESRLNLVGDVDTYNPDGQPPTLPLQKLFAAPSLEARLADITEAAFGERVTVSRVAGQQVSLRLGSSPVPADIPPSKEYLDAMRALPRVAEQGDGVRSFVGLLMALITTQYPVVLVDEPEAFLHPPQARLLGRYVSELAQGRTQVFLATHDANLLKGALDVPNASVTVVRITRSGTTNTPAILAADRVRTFWDDPILRHSNALEALFHRGAVITEADGDSRFYAAALDERDSGRTTHGLLFTHAGGKSRTPVIAAALTAVRVPIAVVLDIDALADDRPLKDLVGQLGGDWAEFTTDLRTIRAAVANLGFSPRISEVREKVATVLADARGDRITREEAEAIRKSVGLDNGWKLLKAGGVHALPQGDASECGHRVIRRLATLGVFIVPVGELERWEPSLGGQHGPAWVTSALAADVHKSSPVQDFVARIASHFRTTE